MDMTEEVVKLEHILLSAVQYAAVREVWAWSVSQAERQMLSLDERLGDGVFGLLPCGCCK